MQKFIDHFTSKTKHRAALSTLLVLALLSSTAQSDPQTAPFSSSQGATDRQIRDWTGIPRYNAPIVDFNARTDLDRTVYVEGMKGNAKDLSKTAFQLVYANYLDEHTNLSQEEKTNRVNELGVKIDKARAAAESSGAVYKRSDELELFFNVAKEVELPPVSPTAVAVNAGIGAGVEFGKYANNKFNEWRNERWGDEKNGEKRTQGQIQSRSYDGALDMMGGKDRVLAYVYDRCNARANCETVNFMSQYAGNGLSPLKSAAQNRQHLDATLSGVFALRMEAEQRDRLLPEKVRAVVVDTEKRILEKQAETDERISQLEKKMETASEEQRRELKKEAKKIREENEKQLGELRKELGKQIIAARDEIHAKVEKFFIASNKERQAEHQAVLKELRNAAIKRQAAEDSAKHQKRLDERLKLQMTYLDAGAGLALLIFDKQSHRDSIRGLHMTATTFVKLVHTLESLQPATSPAISAAAGIAGGTATGAAVGGAPGAAVGAVVSSFVALITAFSPNSSAILGEQIQLLREELHAAREEIRALHQDMINRTEFISDSMDYYFFQTFERFGDVIDILVDVKKDLIQVKADLDRLRIGQAEIQARLTQVERRVIQSFIQGLNEEQNVQYNIILNSMKNGVMDAKDFVAATSRAHTSAEGNARSTLRTDSDACADGHFSSAYDCVPLPGILPQDYLWKFVETVTPGHTVPSGYRFPSVEVWTPWATLFAHVIIDGNELISKVPNPATTVQELQQQLSEFQETLRLQRHFRELARTPASAGGGKYSFPAFSELLAHYRKEYLQLKFQVEELTSRPAQALETLPAENIPPQKVRVTNRNKFFEVPVALFEKLLPPELIELARYYDAESRKAGSATRFYHTMEWDVVIGEHLTSKKETKVPFTMPVMYRAYDFTQGRQDVVTRTWWATMQVDETFYKPSINVRGYWKKRSEKGEMERIPVVNRYLVGKELFKTYRKTTLTNPLSKKQEKLRIKKRGDMHEKFMALLREDTYPVVDSVLAAAVAPHEAAPEHARFIEQMKNSTPEDWVNNNKPSELMATLNQFRDGNKARVSAEVFAVLREVAQGRPYTTHVFDEGQYAGLEESVKGIIGAKRVIGDLLELSIPEIFDAGQKEEMFHALPGAGRLASLITVEDLEAEPTRALDATLNELATQLNNAPAQISKLPAIEPTEALLNRAGEVLKNLEAAQVSAVN